MVPLTRVNVAALFMNIILLCIITHHLIVLYKICMKFHSNSCNSFQLTARTRNSIVNDRREITPIINKGEVWFSCMMHHVIVLYNCMKSIQIAQNSIANDQRNITPKYPKEIMVHVHDTLSHCALEMYEVSTKELLQCSTCRADKKLHLVMLQGK